MNMLVQLRYIVCICATPASMQMCCAPPLHILVCPTLARRNDNTNPCVSAGLGDTHMCAAPTQIRFAIAICCATLAQYTSERASCTYLYLFKPDTNAYVCTTVAQIHLCKSVRSLDLYTDQSNIHICAFCHYMQLWHMFIFSTLRHTRIFCATPPHVYAVQLRHIFII